VPGMSRKSWMLFVPAVVLMAADQTPPPAWASKQPAEWSEDDAKALLADSPWVKTVTPTFVRGGDQNNGPYPGRGYPGRRGGVMFPGGGYPGGGYPGGGYPGGGYPGGGYPNRRQQDDSNSDQTPPKLTVRWESAQPVRDAELKARDVDAPTLEDQNHYAIAVYGVPANMLNGDAKRLADEAKKKATLSRDGKKDLKPSSVQILRRENGPVVLFLFLKPKKEEISKDDRRVEFDAQINRLSFTQSFYLEDMAYQGKTEL